MELRQIRHFVAVAEALSFRRAAERLHMAQPPLSVSIRRLEEEVGAPLFLRGARGVRLTPAGQAALEDARRALSHASQLAAAAQAAAQGERGALRVGFVGSATCEVLPRLVPRFRAAHPRVELVLRESTSLAILAELERGQLDFGLVRYPLVAPTSLVLEPVERDALVAALPARHPLARRRGRLALSALRDEPFVAHSPAAVPALSAVVMLACQRAGFTPRVAQEAVQVQTVLSLVESGLGVALVPSVTTRQRSAALAVRQLDPVPGEAAEIGIAMASRRDDASPLLRHFRAVALAPG
jgi:DNA-binding transcriptional LysR family regulator